MVFSVCDDGVWSGVSVALGGGGWRGLCRWLSGAGAPAPWLWGQESGEAYGDPLG